MPPDVFLIWLSQTHTDTVFGIYFLSCACKQTRRHCFDFRWTLVHSLRVIRSRRITARLFSSSFSCFSLAETNLTWHQSSTAQQISRADPFPSLSFRINTHTLSYPHSLTHTNPHALTELRHNSISAHAALQAWLSWSPSRQIPQSCQRNYP